MSSNNPNLFSLFSATRLIAAALSTLKYHLQTLHLFPCTSYPRLILTQFLLLFYIYIRTWRQYKTLELNLLDTPRSHVTILRKELSQFLHSKVLNWKQIANKNSKRLYLKSNAQITYLIFIVGQDKVHCQLLSTKISQTEHM